MRTSKNDEYFQAESVDTAAGRFTSLANILSPDPKFMSLSPQKVLEDVFGYPEFRGQQQSIIEATLQGRDSLVIMPTGGGKSLCYQIPAMLKEGTGPIDIVKEIYVEKTCVSGVS